MLALDLIWFLSFARKLTSAFSCNSSLKMTAIMRPSVFESFSHYLSLFFLSISTKDTFTGSSTSLARPKLSNWASPGLVRWAHNGVMYDSPWSWPCDDKEEEITYGVSEQRLDWLRMICLLKEVVGLKVYCMNVTFHSQRNKKLYHPVGVHDKLSPFRAMFGIFQSYSS